MPADAAEIVRLAERVEQATSAEAERAELGVEVNEALGIASYITDDGDPCLSMDGAIAIVPDGADWYVTAIRPLTGRFAGAVYDGPHPRIEYAEAATPALALTAAALRARAAQYDQETR